jgi:hypothetical protein
MASVAHASLPGGNLVKAIGTNNLRAYVDGTDTGGHAWLANYPSRLECALCPAQMG